MPRVNHIKMCRKDQGNCSRCGTPLPKGSQYRWIKFRFGGKVKRCMKPSCAFRASDLTNSDKLSRLYGAQEDAQDELAALDPSDDAFDVQDVKNALEQAIEQIREVGEEYQESCDNIREHIAESPTADECEEKADQCEDWATQLEDVDIEDFEWDEDDAELDEFDPDEVFPEFDEDFVLHSNEPEAVTLEEHHEAHFEARRAVLKRAKEAFDEEREERLEEKRQEARVAWAEQVIEEATAALNECPF